MPDWLEHYRSTSCYNILLQAPLVEHKRSKEWFQNFDCWLADYWVPLFKMLFCPLVEFTRTLLESHIYIMKSRNHFSRTRGEHSQYFNEGRDQ